MQIVEKTEYVEFDPPPLFILKTEETAALRDLVAAPPFDESYKALKADAASVLDDKPEPLENIIYEGHVSNHPDRLHSVKHLQDMNKIYAWWAHVVSGDSVYSTKAIEFVDAWAETNKTSGNDVNDNRLLICMDTYRLLEKQMSPSQSPDPDPETWNRPGGPPDPGWDGPDERLRADAGARPGRRLPRRSVTSCDGRHWARTGTDRETKCLSRAS